MPKQLDVNKIVADNPAVDQKALEKAQEAIRDLHQTGAVRRSSYGLETPESKKRLRHSDDSVRGGAQSAAVRRLR
jgi:hypothetical protein